MSSLRCPQCLGLKKTWGLGMIERECQECKGLGYVTLNPEPIIEEKMKRQSKPKHIENETHDKAAIVL